MPDPHAITPVIRSGGSGTRLWPASRRLRPKQFLPLLSSTSLFGETLERVSSGAFAAPLVVCNDEHRFLVAEEFRRTDVEPRAILLEPEPRNTAPAIAAAALHIAEENPETIMLVVPSDHFIDNAKAFRNTVASAAKAAANGYLVTFGVRPTRPETGYGYIQAGEMITGQDGCCSVSRFVEKPDREHAKTYLESDDFSWNSGIFVFSAATVLSELDRFHPEIVAACRTAVGSEFQDLTFCRLGTEAFAQAPSISIDYAVMEKTDKAAVVASDFGWNDIGAWTAIHEMGRTDEAGNVTSGEVILHDVTGSYVRGEDVLIAAVGVEDLIVVATDDAVLVTPKDRAQDVRHVVTQLKTEGREEHESHTRVYRPWGYYQILESGPGFLVKQIMVEAGAKLSLQYHAHRAEHWVIVEGEARVTKGDDVLVLQANQSTYIPVGAAHRLENPGAVPLRLIEVQSGSYVGEDDIVRLEDDYGRG